MAALPREQVPLATIPRPAGRRGVSAAQRERTWGLVFLSPWILGFILFTALPMLASLVFSFSSFSLTNLGDGL
ncbi:MAG: hypothetical protein ABI847_18735, partial [Anaerolineales bacterium]